MDNKSTIQVKSRDNKFIVIGSKNNKPYKITDTQSEALDYAKELSKKWNIPVEHGDTILKLNESPILITRIAAPESNIGHNWEKDKLKITNCGCGGNCKCKKQKPRFLQGLLNIFNRIFNK
jgi:hypothetical protein